MIEKTTAIVAAAICASLAVIFIPGFTAEVAASAAGPTPAARILAAFAVVDAASVPAHSGSADRKIVCAQSWPYYEASCLQDDRQPDGKARVVRIVSIDRTAAGAK